MGKDVNESKFQIHYNCHFKAVRTKINYVRTGCARSLPEVSAVVKVDTASYFTEFFFLLCSHWLQPENQGLSLDGKLLKLLPEVSRSICLDSFASAVDTAVL